MATSNYHSLGEFIKVTRDGGSMDAYVALPRKPNGGAIVLASSLWGINADIRSVADTYAQQGYAVIAPNLFFRLRANHGLDYQTGDSGLTTEDVIGFAAKTSDDVCIADLAASLEALRSRYPVKRSAIIGWCFGGRIACLFAARQEFDLVVGIYPTWLETRLDIAPHVVRPFSLHLPEIEQHEKIKGSIATIVAAFEGNPLVQTFVYSGAKHGFGFAPPHPCGNHFAARLCDARVLLTLDRGLARGEHFQSP